MTALIVLFLLGIANFTLHSAVLDSGHAMLQHMPGSIRRLGGRLTLLAEFAVLVVAMLLSANGWDGESITAAGLGRLRAALESGCWVPDLVMPGLRPDRVDIFPAGVALLDAIFDKLGLPTMHYLPASIQDGVLYRNVARTLASDPR